MQGVTLTGNPFLDFIILIWALLWKGIGLWVAARNTQRNWYIAILLLNTAGIIEIIYLFRFARKRMTLGDLKFWKHFQK